MALTFVFCQGKASHRRADAQLTRNLLFIEIGDGIAFIGFQMPVRRTGCEEHRRSECRLTAMAMPDQRHVPNIGTVEDPHT